MIKFLNSDIKKSEEIAQNAQKLAEHVINIEFQDEYFYDGDNDDKTIVEAVLDYLKDNQKILKDKDITNKYDTINGVNKILSDL